MILGGKLDMKIIHHPLDLKIAVRREICDSKTKDISASCLVVNKLLVISSMWLLQSINYYVFLQR